MNKKLALIAGLSMALAACGGGGGSGDSGAPKPSAPVAASAPSSASGAIASRYTTANGHALPLVIMLRGDSTQYGSHPGESCDGVPNQTCANPSALMQTDMDILFGAGTVHVINRAEPGSTIEDDLYGTGPYTSGPLASELAANKADIVITNAELNDATYKSDPTTYGTFLSTWIRTVRSYGKTAIVEEPNPTCIGPVGSNGARAIDSPYLDQIHEVGTQLNVAVLQTYDSFLQQANWQNNLLQADCEHPADAGYEYKEGQFAKNIAPIVSAMLAP